MLDLIKTALWDYPTTVAKKEDYEELINHSILLLTAPVYKSFQLSPELYQLWNMAILQQIAFNVKYKHIQESLPITVPYVILKGTSAAQCYPNPL